MRLICLLVAAMAIVGLVVFAQSRFTPPPSAVVDADPSWRAIDLEREAAFTRVLEKDRIIRSLLGGELTLDDAAAGFRAVIGADAKAIEFLQNWYDATGDEIYYRNVVSFAKSATKGQPESAAAASARGLEKEVDGRFGRKEWALP